jgi:hypothetical protein
MAQMNFLALAQRAHQEYGLPGDGPVSVLNQIGRNRDVVNWVLSAHEEIQSLRDDWTFDWAQGTFDLTPGTDIYDPASSFGVVGGIREFVRAPGGSYAYPTAAGVNSRCYLRYLEWEEFRPLLIPAV